ncbi:MAG TPA: UvrD-helicase domain-containing protein, partial [Gaiellaceae bacterium]
MDAKATELRAEQAYVDHAYECLEEMRRQVAEAGGAAVGEIDQAVLEAWSARRLATFEDAERGLCFGRVDLASGANPLYVGRRWVHEADEPLVVNWQAPAARPFYTATPVAPQGVSSRRRFRVDGRTLLDFVDEPLDGSSSPFAGGVSDILLEELERARDERMRDIVATIQADQYGLITREPRGALVIQGGPGTGKTAVGLHRASWLLYTYRAELERTGVLVAGPNPVFMEYVSHVLPMLGEERVEQRAVPEILGDGAEVTVAEGREAAARKGELAMAEEIAAAVRALPSVPDELVAVRLDGAELRVYPEQLAELMEEALADTDSLAAARERFRNELARRIYRLYGEKLGGSAYRSFDEVQRALGTGGYLNRVVSRAFPRVTAETLVRRVTRRRAFSEADLALLDEAAALLNGAPRVYGHVIVDEAQDLTPMQLRALVRRARGGSMTLLGDIAQAAGPIGYHSWDDLLRQLDVEVELEELRYAYRVPREMMELALPLLPAIAPDVAAPIAYREGGEPPRFVRVDDALAESVREAVSEAEREGSVALIVPEALLAPAVARLGEGHVYDLAVLTARAAKGLEFDRVVVAEPAAIVAEAG